MSFDKAIADLIAAVNANTEAVKAHTAALSGNAAAPEVKEEGKSAETTTPRGRGRPPKHTNKEDGYTPKYTQSEMQAAVNEVKIEFGTVEAKNLIKDVGGQDRLVDVVDPKKIDELYEAARAKIEGGSDGNGEEEGL